MMMQCLSAETRILSRILLIGWLGLLAACSSTGSKQTAPAAPAAQPAPGPAATTATPAAQPAPAATPPADLTELETLVGRVALYPDDLLSIVLPASTFPLQVVEADRWIQQNKGNKAAVPKESWDESVKALINYPDVVTMMSNDLDWTSAMGEAVAADQTEVMDAVQSFRRKAQSAGNLKSDDKQIVAVEEQVVKIVQADPEIIYVPQYNPQTVVVYQTVPYYPIYYPTPYPVYYYPYPPGYAFASGFFWGVTIGWAFDWHGGHIHNDVNIDIDRNVNIDRGNSINNRPTNIDRNTSQQMQQQGRGSWQSQQSPSNVRQGRTQASTRPAGTGGAAANRAAGGAAQRPAAGGGAAASTRPASGGAAATSRPSATTTNRYGNTSRSASAARSSPPSRDAFSGMSSGRSVGAYSSRGGMSRGGGGMRGGGRR
jgi:uncharacterized protein DUF3300